MTKNNQNGICYIERTTGSICKEKVYGDLALQLLYGDHFISKTIGVSLSHLLARVSCFSWAYGKFQKSACSVKKIVPFIKSFNIDTNEFADNPETFLSFNDFFIRRLKKSARPIAEGSDIAIIPADGRYLFYQHLDQTDTFLVKGQRFCLSELLTDPKLGGKYASGSMVIARLCPSDYHRYHFPCDCTPDVTRLINGWLYSVNPIAIKKNIHIFSQNKRTICHLMTKEFGEVLFLEIGATFVGSIHQTYTPGHLYPKGAEKGYFSFGGSSLILLFEPSRIVFDQDLLAATAKGMEIRCLMGQSMGRSISS